MAWKRRAERIIHGKLRKPMLRPRRQHTARKLRVRRAIAARACDGRDRSEDRALHHRRWRTENNHVPELSRTQRQLQRIGHALAVGVPELRETEKGLYHVHEPLSWCDLQPYARVAVARIPPVVPHAGLDNGRLALMQNTGSSVGFYR